MAKWAEITNEMFDNIQWVCGCTDNEIVALRRNIGRAADNDRNADGSLPFQGRLCKDPTRIVWKKTEGWITGLYLR